MQNIVNKINLLREKFSTMTDDELRNEAYQLKIRRVDESEEKLLPEAFALVRETTKRTLGKEHYDVQLMSGIALANNKISEAKTGEGKTITIYLPAFLKSLTGKGVHVVTVNDYLANRDASDAKKVFDMLGVSVGCVLHHHSIEERRDAYACDITYVTNSELGFDYLKDNLAFDEYDLVLRGFNHAIIDEIDSILIDEAKTPLIISGPGQDSSKLLNAVNDFVLTLEEGNFKEAGVIDKIKGMTGSESGDFIKDEKEKMIYLTESGIAKMEESFGIEDYGDRQTMIIQRSVNNALRANYMMSIDKDYIIKDGCIEIIDPHTGRALPGRRFSDGLHQAIEAKEGVEIKRENVTIATITFQSFFNKYESKSGLTGTAITSAKEFKSIYNLDVVEIPTNKPVIRKDLEDLVFASKEEKWTAVVNEVIATHKTGQPILIGTTSIEDSELLSSRLNENGITHSVLNAKNESVEAEIVSKAGLFGAVTVATNMAGRGTDIVLDEKSLAAGGLKVIGTERHESRRIDNQLKGRSGRQGDPGESQFFVSLEDDVMRVFGDQNTLNTILMFAANPGEPIQYKQLNKFITKAQEAVETENRLNREQMMKYDEANNDYREQVYEQRHTILTAENPRPILESMFNDMTDAIVDKYIPEGTSLSQEAVESIINEYYDKVTYVSLQLDLTGMEKKDFKQALRQLNSLLIENKEKMLPDSVIVSSVEKAVVMRLLDRHWTTFLSSMEHVRKNIGVQSYGQKDPVAVYKQKGEELFNEMIAQVRQDSVWQFMQCSIKVDNK